MGKERKARIPHVPRERKGGGKHWVLGTRQYPPALLRFTSLSCCCVRLTSRLLCTAPETNTLKANREGRRLVPNSLGAERERPGAALSSPVPAGRGRVCVGLAPLPTQHGPGGRCHGARMASRYAEPSQGN